MRNFEDDIIFHQIMKDNLIQSPSNDFEDVVIEEIKSLQKHRSIRVYYYLSLVFASLVALISIIIAISFNEIIETLSFNIDKYFLLITQALIVTIVCSIFSFLINLYRNSFDSTRTTANNT
jgi:O-antigen/teichoic acid export membrane protein